MCEWALGWLLKHPEEVHGLCWFRWEILLQIYLDDVGRVGFKMVWPFFLRHRWGQWWHLEDFCKVLMMHMMSLGYKLLEGGIIKAYLERLSCATHSNTDLFWFIPTLLLWIQLCAFVCFAPPSPTGFCFCFQKWQVDKRWWRWLIMIFEIWAINCFSLSHTASHSSLF